MGNWLLSYWLIELFELISPKQGKFLLQKNEIKRDSNRQ